MHETQEINVKTKTCKPNGNSKKTKKGKHEEIQKTSEPTLLTEDYGKFSNTFFLQLIFFFNI